MFEKILIPIDESEESNWAVDAALEIAGGHPVRFALLNVVDAGPVYTSGFAYAEPPLNEMNRSANSLLDRAASRVPEMITSERIVRQGLSAEDVIIEYAKLWGADLIVMGSHGHGRLAHFLRGATSESVVRHAPCPVMLVRQPVAHRSTMPVGVFSEGMMS